jgi:uncharacterized protein (TIGR02246 family)
MRGAMLSCLLLMGCGAKSSDAPSEAERVVQRGLDAWNKHDVEGALSVFSPDLQLYHFPDQQVTSPLDSLRARWQQRFAKEPKVHVTVSPRIVRKNIVIDHETATGLAGGGTRTADWIYQVEGGRIVRAWLLPE